MTSFEERVTSLEKLLVVILDNIGDTRNAISEGFTKTDNNFTKIHHKIDALEGMASQEFKNVDFNLASIKEEITKINLATGYEEAIKNLRAVQGGKSL